MNIKETIRVRFAPAPTGTMHLGNIRAALINYLFARQQHGTFVLRIEDTDAQRNFDPTAQHIIEHLHWIGLDYDEGPIKGGAYAPYFQSQRDTLYAQARDTLISQYAVYQCFCSTEELEKKRERQIALKLAPRYDRTCLMLSKAEIDCLMNNKTPFVWRFKLDHEQQVTIQDLARGNITFDLKNFSDFPITRADGSFTFIFANFVDDMLMKITHVFRGEDHLSNTANQAALYAAFNMQLPTYYHLPILCNILGQKLSKRDFGFSIVDLQTGGYLPEAICNYLGTLGGGSFTEEVIPFNELINKVHFDNLHATGQVKYDENKLRWFNHQWINRYSDHHITELATPFLQKAFPDIVSLDQQKIIKLLSLVKKEMQTLQDACALLSFFFKQPQVKKTELEACLNTQQVHLLAPELHNTLKTLQTSSAFVQALKELAKKHTTPISALFSFIRLALTGRVKGLGIGELVDGLGAQESCARIERALDEFTN